MKECRRRGDVRQTGAAEQRRRHRRLAGEGRADDANDVFVVHELLRQRSCRLLLRVLVVERDELDGDGKIAGRVRLLEGELRAIARTDDQRRVRARQVAHETDLDGRLRLRVERVDGSGEGKAPTGVQA